MAPMTHCCVTGTDVLSMHTPACLRPHAGTGVDAIRDILVGDCEPASLSSCSHLTGLLANLRVTVETTPL